MRLFEKLAQPFLHFVLHGFGGADDGARLQEAEVRKMLTFGRITRSGAA